MLLKFKKFMIAGLGAICLLSVTAQAAVTPSPQMIEQFKKLPKAEQERVAKQYGLDPSMLDSTMGAQNPQQDFSDFQFINAREVEDEKAKEMREQQILVEEVAQFLKDQKDKDTKKLQPYGYDLFAGEPTTFAPVSDIPIPGEYLVGPGDNIKVQLYGKENREYDLVISRDGTIQFPELGPISVLGLKFDDLRKTISARIKQQMIGVQSNITMGELRSMRIFVAGDAYKPGSYTVSSLSTITQALFVAGGIAEIGSLRNIQLKRNGKLIATLDLYDLLMRGDASKDMRLRSGDVVFIPSVGGLVSVDGEVRRPAIYELVGKESMGEVIAMAGGLTGGAYPKSSSIERYNAQGLKSIKNVDLTTEQGRAAKAKSGDIVKVKTASMQFEDAITVIGAVVRPGKYQWYQGQKISDLLPSVWGDLTPSVDLDYAIIVREINKQGDIEVHQFSPSKSIINKELKSDLELSPRDIVMFFNFSDDSQNRFDLNALVRERVEKVVQLVGDNSLSKDLFKAGFSQLENQKLRDRSQLGGVVVAKEQAEDDEALAIKGEVNRMMANLFEDSELIQLSGLMNRSELLYPIIMKLNHQSRSGTSVQVVAIKGQVYHEGMYPLAVNARISEVVTAAGGLKEGAYTSRAELTRTNTLADGSSITHKNIELLPALNGELNANLVLQGRDILTVMTTPEWQENKSVEIRGEVRFPGVYNIRRGESLKDVVERAGGFTDYAYLPSSVFVRESVRLQEQLEIKKLADQLRRDIATRGVSKDGDVVNYADVQMMLSDLENIEAVGRLVVDLSAISIGIEQADLQLEDSDVLYVPSTKQTIAVMGEVQYAATHRFKEGLTLDQYLNMSGGVRERADDGRTYVIKANGSVMLPSHSMWFSSEDKLQPGDTIIVPLDTEYKDNLTLWTQVTSIIYNTAVAFASISGI
ncbi:SLBB domain-containing protein [Shewanella eurypsychrophilus]|uniref:SLBB domain-containing protein n=1 Tax=Shewanella eurypsychrophilus TaxID=2593656 RepID=A0ABX6VDW7_9GAMM|nr:MULTISPECIES: SLBB domain-containing protein [Shewanella]QFU23457.1 sugar transporter [Shewanella sp. YLB-09]QPG58686.1 SLBB domain-containing protein [Shewanella eurypsychrophilus]